MITFPDEINPKHGLKVRFINYSRAIQYLDFFEITTNYPSYRFLPMNLVFQSSGELHQFLRNKGIIFVEVEVNEFTSKITKSITVVDSSKIKGVEESITSYLLNYKYYSINEVAEMLSFSRPTVYKLVRENKLKAVRVYGQLRIKHLDLIAYINTENQL